MEASGVDRERLSHQLRNCLAAVAMLLEYVEEEVNRGDDPRETLARAQAGVKETLEIVARELSD